MKYDAILLDIETQRDFFLREGSCYTSGAKTARQRIYRLFDWARKNRHPVMSTVLRIPAGRIGPLAEEPHCIEGSEGEKKLSKTVIRPYINLGMRSSTDLPEDLFENYRQAIFEKRDTDIFLHARAERLITELPRVSFVICGAGVAQGIVQAAVGLRNRGFGVALVEDAVLDLDDPGASMAYDRMLAKGVVFAKTADITSPRKTNNGKSAAFRRPSGVEI